MEGVSTRRVDDLVRSLGCEGISKSQVSRICTELDGVVKSFLERPLEVYPKVVDESGERGGVPSLSPVAGGRRKPAGRSTPEVEGSA